MGAERPNIFEFNTSTLLEKTLKAPPSHFKFKQNFIFFLLFWGARVWVPMPLPQYQNPNGYVAVYVNSSPF